MKLSQFSKPASQATPDFVSQAVEQGRIFYQANPASSDGLTVVCGGREHCRADYHIDRGAFPYYCLEWVASGQGELKLGGTTHPLQSGSLFLYGPAHPHRILTHPERRLVKYFVDFTGPRARRLLRRKGLEPPAFRLLPPASGMLEFFDQLIETGCGSSPARPQLLQHLLECLLTVAAARYPDPSIAEGRAYLAYRRCRTHIETHFHTLHRIEDIAQACHLDPAYLTRLFRRFSGESPHHFLTRLKMNTAALQLIRGNALVKETAASFGYSDPYHFSKTFKKIHGLSPKAYLQVRRG